jgi:hypothetical protein
MKTSGIVFDMARLFTQPVVTDALIDKSRYHFNGTANAISAWEKLPSGLYCPKMVSASSSYYAVPDITPLLGAKQATWMGWVRKDAYVQYSSVMNDFGAVGSRRWRFGYEGAENRWYCDAGDGTTFVPISISSIFTTGWHFVWERFTGGSATGLECGCDGSTATPVSVATVLTLGVGVKNQTYIGRAGVYSSITLATLRIHNIAISDSEIWKYRESTRRMIGI